MSSRSLFLSTVLVVVVSSLAGSSCGSEGASSTGPWADDIELTQGDACGDAYFWAATPSGDVAVTIDVDAWERSNDDPTTIAVVLPDSAVTTRVLRGKDMVDNFCNDVMDGDKDPTS